MAGFFPETLDPIRDSGKTSSSPSHPTERERILQEIDPTTKQFLGILNLTEDSFSDGGRFLEPTHAIAQGESLLRDGASILDIGAQSSNPDSIKVSPETEISRLSAVISYFKEKGASISIDTYEPEVQRFALRMGADFLNDIQGFPHPEFYPELSDTSARLILMHSIQRSGHATRIDSDPASVFQGILDFFDERVERLLAAGISRDRLILDPGMGFFLGSNPESSFYALRKTRELKERYDLPLLISVSRKSFLAAPTGKPIHERGPATLAAELYALEQGADFIRTHEPGATRDGWLVRKAIGGRG